ncbi:MAG: hypothetical protein J7647_10070 [Cyanobacteria bacterium SBLK]|nr:hypothetical protein [Cyanobacteria bacterium SBLK]
MNGLKGETMSRDRHDGGMVYCLQDCSLKVPSGVFEIIFAIAIGDRLLV